MPTFSTSVPPLQFTSTGIVIPLESDIFAGVIADMNAAFGGNMNTALTTPQGQLASSLTAIIGDNYNTIAALVNYFDPATASGITQDAIANIYDLTRNPAEPTALEVACLGAQGVIIPVGAQVVDPQGNIYTCTILGTIPSGGTITLQFANTTPGAIPVPASVSISQTIPGWDRATLVSGVEGSDVETQGAFEIRRQTAIAVNSRGTLPAIRGNVSAVPNVLDVYVTANTAATTVAFGVTNYALVAHSIYVAVVGGASTDIANAIWLAKNDGSDYNGNTSVTVTDTVGYSVPYPAYVVKYNIPTPTAVHFSVQIANSSNIPSNVATLVQNALISAFAGNASIPRAQIGSTIYATSYYGTVMAAVPGAQIISIQVGLSVANANSVTMGIDQGPTLISSNIIVSLS